MKRIKLIKESYLFGDNADKFFRIGCEGTIVKENKYGDVEAIMDGYAEYCKGQTNSPELFFTEDEYEVIE